MSDPGRSVAALGFGVGYSLTAVALLVQALGLAAVPWSTVVPAILVLCGLVLVLAGPAGPAARARHQRRD